jgi:DNA-binding MarR family transcriptional regulator
MTTRSATPPDTASRVWTALHEFVAGEDRRRAIRAALDLGPAKVEVLIKLADGPMTLRDIARAVGLDPPAATVGVDKLEARGLVHRMPHPDDNRRKLVTACRRQQDHDAGAQTAHFEISNDFGMACHLDQTMSSPPVAWDGRDAPSRAGARASWLARAARMP